MRLALIYQPMINFIGNNIGALFTFCQLGDLLHAIERKQIAGRIRGRVDKYGFGLRGDFLSDDFRSVLKTVFFIYRDCDQFAIHKFDKIRIAGIVRI